MFALRAIAATLSLFAISYAGASCFVFVMWRTVHRLLAGRSSVTLARGLYLLRVAPLRFAIVVSLLYELPSFLRFEPAGAAEGLSPVPLLCSALVLLAGLLAGWRMRVACRLTRELCSAVANAGRKEVTPLFAVAGAIKQRMLITQRASGLLDQEELARALAHESAHIRSRDNLRKLILLACPVPGLRMLEDAWADAAEFAADERAVSNRREALALASAIVKVASLQLPSIDHRVLVTNFVGSAATTALRVQKLASWQPADRAGRRSRMLTVVSAALLTAFAIASYPALTYALHPLTEMLFR